MERVVVPQRSIGQERLSFAPTSRSSSTLDRLSDLIDWTPVACLLEPLYPASKGEPAWPPLAMFKALLLAVWHDLSDVKLAEALEDRASFRRFCGFSSSEPTPERTAFVRFRRVVIAHGLDRVLFERVTADLKARAITVKTGTLVDATIATPSFKVLRRLFESSQYAAQAYRELLVAHEFVGSMGRRGNPYDNAKAESFMKTLKVEAVYPMEFESFEDAAAYLPRFIEAIYNRRRLHSSLGYMSPVQFEEQHVRPPVKAAA
jgi:Transposase domain (DUF772)/Integrase core domain